MKYKNILRMQPGHTFIGYGMVNTKRGTSITIGEQNALVVMDKVNKFEAGKGYIPMEVSFEDILTVLDSTDAVYAFDKPCLVRYIKNLEELDIDEEVRAQLESFKEWQPSDENQLCILIFD